MSKTSIHPVHVEFGDCDPAGIVFFPNFSRWMDAASHHFFRHCGLPPWHALEAIAHCIGAPLLEIHTRFFKPATYGEDIQVHTSVVEWRAKVFVQQHRVMRGGDLLCEGRETRALCIKPPEAALPKAILIPDWLRTQCE
jgi:4-hydroxybenzoyl-CoA thioesterase